MGATGIESCPGSWTVFVTDSYCDSESVLVHAADQNCKDTGRVISKMPDESGVGGKVKVLNAAKAFMRIGWILLVPEPFYQCSTIGNK